MSTYKVAVLGCGGRSGAHLDAYRHIDRAKVVAVCDRHAEKVGPVAEKYGARAYTDAATMLQKEKPDLLHIVTAPRNRVGELTLAHDCGVPAVTVEKPLATNVLEWKQLCDLQARSKTRFAVCHQLRWQQDVVRLRHALQSGKLGKVKFLDLSAGFNIAGQGTHILNYGMSLNGDVPVTRVFGAAGGDSEMASIHPAPDHTEGYLTFADGVRALWVCGPTAPRCGDPAVSWQHVRIAAYAERGRVEWQEFGRWEIVGPDKTESGTFGDFDTWMARNILSQAGFHEAMFDWIEDDANPAGTNLKQSLHEWEVVLALYASAVWRRPVDLAGFNPPEDLFQQLAEVLRNNHHQEH
jgi:predicted dehydrogenase